VEEGVTITREDLNNWEKNILREKIPRLTTGKKLVQRIFLLVAFRRLLPTLGWKVLQLPSKTG
jgi:hypothetical protein